MSKSTPKTPDKTNTAAAEIRKLLPQLPPQDAKELRTILDTYYVPKQAETNTDWLLSGIQHEMRRRGLGCPPLTKKFIHQLAPIAVEHAAAVRETLAASARRSPVPSLSTAQWQALGRLCAECLAKLIVSWKVPDDEDKNNKSDDDGQQWKSIPLTVQTMLRNIWRTTEALDYNFPGYLRAGVIHFLVPVREPAEGGPTEKRREARYQDKRFPPRKRSKPDDDEDRVWSEDEFAAEVKRQDEIKRKGLEAAAKLEAEDRDFMTEDEFIDEVYKQERIKRDGLERAAELEIEDQDFWTEDQFDAEVRKQEAIKKAGLERARRQGESAADDRRERAALRRYHGTTSPNEDDDEEPDDEG